MEGNNVFGSWSVASAPGNTNPNVGYDTSGGWSGLDNLFTGNLDWERKIAEMNFNSSEAALNRNWQEYMSNTSYQRMAQDMKLAGLNPYLAYSGSGGASTPSGSTAHSSGAGSTPSGRGFGMIGQLASLAINTGMAIKSLNQQRAFKIADLALKQQSISTPRNYIQDVFDSQGEFFSRTTRRYY